MKWMVSYSATERKANIAAVNLFFSALLGASLGSMGALPLWDYGATIVLLVGAVGAIFTIAFSERPRMIVVMSLALGFMLTAVIASPDLRIHDDMQRLALALIIWLAILLAIRISPGVENAAKTAAPPPEDEESFLTP